MTLRHFKIFVAVCDTMNMTSAAEALFISQSAVSQAIAELENHYGVRLFERLSRKLYLTQAGQKLLGYARHMIRMNTEAENDMKTLYQNGTIRLGASVTVGGHVLPGVVSRFREQNPLVKIEVIEDNTAKIETLILKDTIDLGLVEGETVSPDVISRAFMEDELVLVCSPSHRFAGCEEVEPKELEKENFIIREKGSGTRKTFEDKMAENGLTWEGSWTCNNADTIKNAVAAGLGVSVISGLAVKNEVETGLLCQKHVRGIRFQRRFKLIYHKNKYLTKAMREFMSFFA
ncbi:LysR family transcriptional regulator [Caproiciproducens faecalis]|uniref:LysR family transcriptional regulator n=1 Tax=Caproiciproducens faecalis TaxID=2820301 RepID=A0ABS7DLF5_9FIRM|nr:LysR family transcriptional regulator [Caproiciproducens faecalis]MBW7572112.1 LysR family transcriptional regulator [Caproiciproducens faecalis]